ncbi:AAA family ATPase [Palleronia sp. LCG004]|uniref:AAA family ATPase n=1 Tax=Palleronia sp. LCG004 TaxID=3079304 RepID=UPI002941FD71|nr:AAA family ATPase [Palleronia sp. LCG004]WOI58428.1 AAA family ATPase [Palleronia sp. LCG004]
MPPALPPYFGLDPDAALAALPAETAIESFVGIARAAASGRQDLIRHTAASFLIKDDLRLFSTWEITRYLIPIAQGHFRRVLKQNPALPQGRSDTPGGARWFTLEEVMQLKAHFGEEGSKAKEYLPYRPAGMQARICTLANLVASTGKTTNVAHLAMSAALDGYKVLTIDLDPQGGLGVILGRRAENEWQTVLPLLAKHYAQHLRSENQRRLDRGDPPVPLDDMLDRALGTSGSDLVQPTRWPNLDHIGAHLDLARAELQIPAWQMQGRSWKPWNALKEMLASEGLLDAYDVVLIDTGPSLGTLTIGGVAAADILFVPLGATLDDFDATTRFLKALHATFRMIEDSENQAARALGREETRFFWDAVRLLVTRYDEATQAENAALMQASLGSALVPRRQALTPLIGQGEGRVRAVYEADYRNFNREIYSRARESFDATYATFKQLLIGTWRRAIEATGPE